MEKLASLLFFSALVGHSLEDDITSSSAEVFSASGRPVTLSCQYSVKAENLQWYRQDPGSAPHYLLLITDTQEPQVVRATPPDPRLTAELNQERNGVTLQISSAAVTDSAVYYCAVRPAVGSGVKLVFGTGTKLNIQTRDDYEPSYYELGDVNGTSRACLATGFSRSNATLQNELFRKSNSSRAVRASGDSLHSEVLLLSETHTGKCENGTYENESVVCVETLDKDVTVNTVSLLVVALRLLFIKTVVFNVLMTLRLWLRH